MTYDVIIKQSVNGVRSSAIYEHGTLLSAIYSVQRSINNQHETHIIKTVYIVQNTPSGGVLVSHDEILKLLKNTENLLACKNIEKELIDGGHL